MTNGLISLSDDLQFKWFRAAMKTMAANFSELSEYDRDLFDKLSDGFTLAERDLTLTVKQMNYIRAIEAQLDSHTYKGN